MLLWWCLMYFVFGSRNGFWSMFPMCVLRVGTLSFEEVESTIDCAFWTDDSMDDVSLLYAWVWEIDGYSDYVEVLDGINELIDDSSEDTKLLILYFFLVGNYKICVDSLLFLYVIGWMVKFVFAFAFA